MARARPLPTAGSILVVENRPVERNGLASLLQLEGFEVVAVADAASARERLAGETFDLVIADLTPGQNPLRLLQPPACDAPPVIVISGDARPAVRDAALRQGAAAFLGKPLAIDQFLDEVRRALERIR